MLYFSSKWLWLIAATSFQSQISGSIYISGQSLETKWYISETTVYICKDTTTTHLKALFDTTKIEIVLEDNIEEKFGINY